MAEEHDAFKRRYKQIERNDAEYVLGLLQRTARDYKEHPMWLRDDAIRLLIAMRRLLDHHDLSLEKPGWDMERIGADAQACFEREYYPTFAATEPAVPKDQ